MNRSGRKRKGSILLGPRQSNSSNRNQRNNNHPRNSNIQPISSKKKHFVITCNGCKETFTNFRHSQEFISLHCLSNLSKKECIDALFPCELCSNKWFYTTSARDEHFKVNKQCKKHHLECLRAKNITASEVTIVTVNEEKNPIKDINKTNATAQANVRLPFTSNQSHIETNVFAKNLSDQLRSLKPSTINTCMIDVETSSHSMLLKENEKPQTYFKKSIDDASSYNNSIENDSNSSPIQETIIRSNNEESDEDDEYYNQNDYEKDILNQSNQNNSNSGNEDIQEYNIEYNEVNERTGHIDECSIQNNSSHPLNIESISASNVNHTSVLTNKDGMSFTSPYQVVDLTNEFVFYNFNDEVEDKQIKNNVDSQYTDGLFLIHEMMAMNLPLTFYDRMMAFKHGKYKKGLSFMSLPDLKAQALARVHGESFGQKLMPITTRLKCPSGRYVNVVTFNIHALIFDLLSDKKLTCMKNLIFQDGDEDDPFRLLAKNYYGDFDTSEYYRKTAFKIRDGGTTHLEVPIVLYMDETNLDSYSKLTLHPVTMTFMMYNRQTRNLERAWRTLGYMPNLQGMTGTKSMSSESKLSDYHFVLKFILSGIENLQDCRSDGFHWKFQFPEYPGKTYERTLHFPLGLVIGDGKGSDTSCGKYQSRNKVTHICRDCNVLFQDSDKPDATCSFHKMKVLLSKNKEDMNNLSYHKIEPFHAFESIEFGENPYGIMGCTPPDNCHQINKGIIERLPEIFLARCTKKMVEVIDVHSAFIAKNMKRQSDRSVPSLSPFRHGLSEVAKLTSNENIGRVFVMYLVLLTRDFEDVIVSKKGRKYDKNTPAIIISQEEYNKWIVVFEETLILYAWAYLDEHPKAVFQGGKNSAVNERMKHFMRIFSETASRRTGTGLKLMKFHQLLHLWLVCRMFGVLPNVDSARNESHHRKKKSIAAKTQCRFEVLDEQTAVNEFYFNLFLKAMKQEKMKVEDKFEMNFEKNHSISGYNSDNDTTITNDHANTTALSKKQGSRYTLTFDYVNKKVVGKWKGKKVKKKSFSYPMLILQSIYTKYEGYNAGDPNVRIDTIDCFTEHRCIDDPSIVYRCCPDYMKNGNWFDWAYIRWDGYDEPLEGQLLMFLDLKSITFKQCNPTDHPRPLFTPVNMETAVLVHSVKHDTIAKQRKPSLPNHQQRQGPVTRLARFGDMEDTFHIVDTSSIRLPAFVITDRTGDNNKLEPGRSNNIISINPLKQWHLHFLDYTNTEMLEEMSQRVDDNVNEDDDVYDYEK